jgi:hypothetical protein
MVKELKLRLIYRYIIRRVEGKRGGDTVALETKENIKRERRVTVRKKRDA